MVPVNYLAILVCGIASMVLGFLWYGMIFKKTWMGLMGMDPNNMGAMTPEKKNAANKGYIISFIGSLVMAYVLSHNLVFAMNYLHTEGISAGLQTGFWTWLGFIAPVTLGSVLWENKSWNLWFLNNAYQLVQLLIFGVILALWQ